MGSVSLDNVIICLSDCFLTFFFFMMLEVFVCVCVCVCVCIYIYCSLLILFLLMTKPCGEIKSENEWIKKAYFGGVSKTKTH